MENELAGRRGDIAWLRDSHAWPGLAAIGKVTATREIDGKTSTRTRYYLLSQAFDPVRSMPSSAVTGASRTACTGCST